MADSPLDLLTASSRRPKIHDAVLNTKLPATVKALVEAEAKRREVDTSVITREALAEYLARRGY
jgi:hypothetical protein